MTRWREISDTTPPVRRIERCEDHGLTHHGVCPSCRADQLAGTA